MQLQKSTIPEMNGTMTFDNGTNAAINFPEQLVAFGNKFNTLLGVQLDQFLYNKSEW